MIVRLPSHVAGVSCSSMQGKFTSFLLVFALLFGTVIMPTIAHAQATSVSHSEEFLELHKHESADQETQQHDEEKPCHAVAHHHCSIALRADATSVGLISVQAQNSFSLSSSIAMTSLSQAPPTEPPAA